MAHSANSMFQRFEYEIMNAGSQMDAIYADPCFCCIHTRSKVHMARPRPENWGYIVKITGSSQLLT